MIEKPFVYIRTVERDVSNKRDVVFLKIQKLIEGFVAWLWNATSFRDTYMDNPFRLLYKVTVSTFVIWETENPENYIGIIMDKCAEISPVLDIKPRFRDIAIRPAVELAGNIFHF